MPEHTSEHPDRRGFGRTVGLGLATAGLTAVAAHRQWVTVDGADEQTRALADAALTSGADVGSSPVAGALALVLLATWGVLLVTRGRVRRIVAVLGLLAAIGVVAAVVSGFAAVPDTVRKAIGPGADVEVGLGWWFWVSALAALAAVVATVQAVRQVPSWPEMGSRYDAPSTDSPTGSPTADAPPLEDQSNLELWKSIDEGRDPTT